MEKREFKDRVFSELGKIGHALSHQKRLEIIDLLSQAPRTVEKIARETNMSVANTSKHLQVLKAGNLVEINRKGNFIFYRLTNQKVMEIWKLLRDFGTERIGEIEKLLRDFRSQKQLLESITIDALLKKLEVENIVLLDVRPLEEFNTGHIPKAISIPIEQLAERLKELPKTQEVIAYCRGPFCVFADEALQLLILNKFKAKRLVEGFPDWKLKGLPVETSA